MVAELFEQQPSRKMATIRTISEIKKHDNADALEIAIIDGWQCVTAKDNGFKQGDLVVYFEIDSWIPTEIAPFLSKGKEPREYEGVKGERLRSIKLRGELSQGMIMPLSILQGVEGIKTARFEDGDDVTTLLNIQKWERPINPQLAGMQKGNFPSFIRKTDQERIQNMFKSLTREHFVDFYEVTLKVDGSSMTVFHKDGEVGVCSRNLELKTDEGNANNSFVKKFVELDMGAKLKALGRNIAIQGELFGSGINGNWEGLSNHKFMVFDIFDIDTQKYLCAVQRQSLIKELGLESVPVLAYMNLEQFQDVKHFLQYAERPSINNKIAEGVVFKSLLNPDFSFKVVSNSYLLGGGE